MRILSIIYSTNVRLISTLSLLLMLSACASTGAGNAVGASVCPPERLLVCESFASERKCRCSDTSRVVRSLTAIGPSGW